jgi:methylmalonyl-CoA mutase N-terminal domain/subunit
LSQGTTGLSVAFDLPTQIGLDSDDPLADGEVGKVGVAIDSIDDMLTLLNGIPLHQVSTSMTINATASTLLCLYLAVAKKQGVAFDKVSGTIQNDILKEYIARGTYIFPPRPSMRLITDLFAYCHRNVPKWNTISISGYHIREAGSPADYRHVRILRRRGPELEHDLDLRLPHPRGRFDSSPGDRVHACRWDLLRAGCDRRRP